MSLAQYEAETTNQDAMVMVRIYRWAKIVTHKNVDLLNSDKIPHSALVDPTTRKQNKRSWDMGEIVRDVVRTLSCIVAHGVRIHLR